MKLELNRAVTLEKLQGKKNVDEVLVSAAKPINIIRATKVEQVRVE